MKEKRSVQFFCYIAFIVFANSKIIAQKNISSYVLDFENNKPVQDVSIQIKNTNKGTTTNTKGFFKIDRISNKAILILSKIGYEKIYLPVQKLQKTIYLIPKISSLKEVELVVRSFSSSQLKKIVPDQIYLSQKDIEKLPFILGEKDVIKLIQYTPGVQQATEGQSGLLVRGGNGSMNLTLLDNIYLHNIAHLGGVFSAINSDFVNSLQFSKAGFDAEYGGRLSSVIDIKTLTPPDSTYFKGSIGLLTSKLTSNIKINKKNSLLLSGRRTYLEIFKPFLKDDNSILSRKKNYFLYDLFAKHSLKINAKNTLETTFYATKDNFKDKTKGRDRGFEWGNTIIGTTFKHQFSSKLQSQTTVFSSNYKLSIQHDDGFLYTYKAKSNFGVYGLKHYFLWNSPDKYTLKIGGEYNKNKILPKDVKATIDYIPLEILNQEVFNYDDFSVYGDLEIPLNQKTELKTGLRASSFFNKENALIDKETFYTIEPRVSFKYKLSNKEALKASYQRLSQFVHQASVSTFSSPTDFFILSTDHIKPQIVNQFSAGYAFEKRGLHLNSAVYYKDITNYTEFENGSVNNLLSNNLYEDILVGKLKSFGIEFSLNKKINKLASQISLTLSKTLAKFKEINNANYYPPTFDRPVNFNSINHYRLNDRIELGALFLFTTGQNYTRPRDIRIINEEPIVNFEPKNASRYPDYHRLDLSCTYSFKNKGKWNSRLNLTVYNIYNNKNPFYISSALWGSPDESFIQVSDNVDNLFPILPTLNWIFSF